LTTLELSLTIDFSWTSLVSKLFANIPTLFHVLDHTNIDGYEEENFKEESSLFDHKEEKVCDGF